MNKEEEMRLRAKEGERRKKEIGKKLRNYYLYIGRNDWYVGLLFFLTFLAAEFFFKF